MEAGNEQTPHPPRYVRKLLTGIDKLLEAVVRSAELLVLPLALLLFLQWPLREIVHAYSREANDLAQILFALYVSMAIAAATRQNGHLASDTLARHFRERTRARLKRIIAFAVLIPWSSFMLWAAWPATAQSLRDLERFSETNNFGYFIIKASVALLIFAVLMQGFVDAFREPPDNAS